VIAALLLCASLAAADKPFVVSWSVRWKHPLAETMHSKRFRYAREAVEFELAAPLCSAQAPPCVAWIKSDVVSINPKFKTAALRKKVNRG
jgi:ABC-type microcin C transport system permease subunit YejE